MYLHSRFIRFIIGRSSIFFQNIKKHSIFPQRFIKSTMHDYWYSKTKYLYSKYICSVKILLISWYSYINHRYNPRAIRYIGIRVLSDVVYPCFLCIYVRRFRVYFPLHNHGRRLAKSWYVIYNLLSWSASDPRLSVRVSRFPRSSFISWAGVTANWISWE